MFLQVVENFSSLKLHCSCTENTVLSTVQDICAPVCTSKKHRQPIQYQQAFEVHMGSHGVCVGSLWQQTRWQTTLSSWLSVNIRLLLLPNGQTRLSLWDQQVLTANTALAGRKCPPSQKYKLL